MRISCLARVAAVTLAAVLGVTSLSSGQDRIVYDDNAPKQYNEQIQPINEKIDSLGKSLDNDSLSMTDAAAIIEQQSELRGQADSLWDSTEQKIDAQFSAAREEIVKFNNQNRELEYSTAIVGSNIDFFNNVGKYSTKDDFEQNRNQMSASWEKSYGNRLKVFGEDFDNQKKQIFENVKSQYGIDLDQTGYSRIGTSNPYTGEVYYKYYGPDGKPLYAQWENDANGWKKYREDVETARRRQRDQRDQLEKQVNGLKGFESDFNSSRTSGAASLASLENRVKRVNFAGSWSGSDNLNNWLQLTLNPDGTTRYTWGRTETVYDGAGTWSQSGGTITMRTNDGEWSHRSTITDQFELQFIETSSTGRTYTNYLRRN